MPALPGEIGEYRSATGLLPQPLEYQRRSDPVDRNLDRRIMVAAHSIMALAANRAPERTSRSLSTGTTLHKTGGNSLITHNVRMDTLEIASCYPAWGCFSVKSPVVVIVVHIWQLPRVQLSVNCEQLISANVYSTCLRITAISLSSLMISPLGSVRNAVDIRSRIFLPNDEIKLD